MNMMDYDEFRERLLEIQTTIRLDRPRTIILGKYQITIESQKYDSEDKDLETHGVLLNRFVTMTVPAPGVRIKLTSARMVNCTAFKMTIAM